VWGGITKTNIVCYPSRNAELDILYNIEYIIQLDILYNAVSNSVGGAEILLFACVHKFVRPASLLCSSSGRVINASRLRVCVDRTELLYTMYVVT